MTDPLIVDAYEGDGRKDWSALADAGRPWCGVILKATQGNYYAGGTWFGGQWRLVELAGVHAHRGGDWIRGAYHYLDVRVKPDDQAAYFLGAIKRAGGLAQGDVLMVDVERAGQREAIGRQQVIDCVTRFAECIHASTGKGLILYGGAWLAELGIVGHMGCRLLAVARYGETLPSWHYTRLGWELADLALWQYCGVAGGGVLEPAPEHALKGYPRSAPGCGAIDISALVLAGGVEGLRQRLA